MRKIEVKGLTGYEVRRPVLVTAEAAEKLAALEEGCSVGACNPRFDEDMANIQRLTLAQIRERWQNKQWLADDRDICDMTGDEWGLLASTRHTQRPIEVEEATAKDISSAPDDIRFLLARLDAAMWTLSRRGINEEDFKAAFPFRPSTPSEPKEEQ